jgi:hypothetical protein
MVARSACVIGRAGSIGPRAATAEAPVSASRSCTPNHRLRKAVTALAIGNAGNPGEVATGEHGSDGHATEGCRDANHATQKPRSHDTSRMA